MSPQQLTRQATGGIESGHTEVQPGQAALLKTTGRPAPELAQLAKAARPQAPKGADAAKLMS